MIRDQTNMREPEDSQYNQMTREAKDVQVRFCRRTRDMHVVGQPKNALEL